MTRFELDKGKRNFFKVWLIILIVLWVIAVLIAILKFAT
jgi:hypothetical protein